MRFEDKTRSDYSLWYMQLSTQRLLCKAKVKAVFRRYCLKAHPNCSRQSPVQINCTNAEVNIKGVWKCMFIFWLYRSPMQFQFHHLKIIWITPWYILWGTLEMERKRHLINASMLIIHKGKKCWIISTALYLRWTVVLCSCALRSAPRCISAEQPCLFNPGVEHLLYFYLAHL